MQLTGPPVGYVQRGVPGVVEPPGPVGPFAAPVAGPEPPLNSPAAAAPTPTTAAVPSTEPSPSSRPRLGVGRLARGGEVSPGSGAGIWAGVGRSWAGMGRGAAAGG